MTSEQNNQKDGSAPDEQKISSSQRQYRQASLRSIVLTVVSMIIIGSAAFFAFQYFSHTNTGTNGNTTGGSNPSGTPTPTLPAIKRSQPDLPTSFYTLLKSQVAQGLHLSVAQISARLQAPVNPPSPPPGIANIATQQGISAAQLHTIEVNAYITAYNAMAKDGIMTQQLANEDIQYYSQTSWSHLNDQVTQAFGGKVRGNNPSGGNGGPSQSVATPQS